MAEHQKKQRIDPADPARIFPNNRFNNARFDDVDIEKLFAEIDGIRYLKDPLNFNYTEKNI